MQQLTNINPVIYLGNSQGHERGNGNMKALGEVQCCMMPD